jgi:melanoma-associated antigen p97
MRAIRLGEADIVVLDAGDVYRAGYMFGLIPIMAEVYNLDGPYYYAVAVTKQRDNSSELIYLKTKNTCHTVSYGSHINIILAYSDDYCLQ